MEIQALISEDKASRVASVIGKNGESMVGGISWIEPTSILPKEQ